MKKGPPRAAGSSPADLAPLNDQLRVDLERRPLHVLYADCNNICESLHHLVLQALGAQRHVFPIRVSSEQEIRFHWAQTQFHCAFLVLNNIFVSHSGTTEDRIEKVLTLIPWLRKRSSALIIALSGWRPPGIEQEAIRAGADCLFPLPFPAQEVLDLLTKHFGGQTGP